MEKERIKKLFPHLYKEIEEGVAYIPLSSAKSRSEVEVIESVSAWSGYEPDVIDFIRRCKTIEQAEEIIAYMENRKEITRQRAKDLRTQLRKDGLRSFGSYKREGFYHREVPDSSESV